MTLRRFVWLHLLDKRSVFDARPDLARPPVPYPLLAAQAVLVLQVHILIVDQVTQAQQAMFLVLEVQVVFKKLAHPP